MHRKRNERVYSYKTCEINLILTSRGRIPDNFYFSIITIVTGMGLSYLSSGEHRQEGIQSKMRKLEDSSI